MAFQKEVARDKYDNNKPSISLIDPDFLEGLAKVLDFGAKKYKPNNWRYGIHVSRLLSACYRHLGEINKGKNLDSESGLPIVYHLASEVMFLAWMLENKKEYDDRYNRAESFVSIAARNEQVIGGYSYSKNYTPQTSAAQGFNLGDNPA